MMAKQEQEELSVDSIQKAYLDQVSYSVSEITKLLSDNENENNISPKILGHMDIISRDITYIVDDNFQEQLGTLLTEVISVMGEVRGKEAGIRDLRNKGARGGQEGLGNTSIVRFFQEGWKQLKKSDTITPIIENKEYDAAFIKEEVDSIVKEKMQILKKELEKYVTRFDLKDYNVEMKDEKIFITLKVKVKYVISRTVDISGDIISQEGHLYVKELKHNIGHPLNAVLKRINVDIDKLLEANLNKVDGVLRGVMELKEGKPVKSMNIKNGILSVEYQGYEIDNTSNIPNISGTSTTPEVVTSRKKYLSMADKNGTFIKIFDTYKGGKSYFTLSISPQNSKEGTFEVHGNEYGLKSLLQNIRDYLKPVCIITNEEEYWEKDPKGIKIIKKGHVKQHSNGDWSIGGNDDKMVIELTSTQGVSFANQDAVKKWEEARRGIGKKESIKNDKISVGATVEFDLSFRGPKTVNTHDDKTEEMKIKKYEELHAEFEGAAWLVITHGKVDYDSWGCTGINKDDFTEITQQLVVLGIIGIDDEGKMSVLINDMNDLKKILKDLGKPETEKSREITENNIFNILQGLSKDKRNSIELVKKIRSKLGLEKDDDISDKVQKQVQKIMLGLKQSEKITISFERENKDPKDSQYMYVYTIVETDIGSGDGGEEQRWKEYEEIETKLQKEFGQDNVKRKLGENIDLGLIQKEKIACIIIDCAGKRVYNFNTGASTSAGNNGSMHQYSEDSSGGGGYSNYLKEQGSNQFQDSDLFLYIEQEVTLDDTKKLFNNLFGVNDEGGNDKVIKSIPGTIVGSDFLSDEKEEEEEEEEELGVESLYVMKGINQSLDELLKEGKKMLQEYNIINMDSADGKEEAKKILGKISVWKFQVREELEKYQDTQKEMAKWKKDNKPGFFVRFSEKRKLYNTAISEYEKAKKSIKSNIVQLHVLRKVFNSKNLSQSADMESQGNSVIDPKKETSKKKKLLKKGFFKNLLGPSKKVFGNDNTGVLVLPRGEAISEKILEIKALKSKWKDLIDKAEKHSSELIEQEKKRKHLIDSWKLLKKQKRFKLDNFVDLEKKLKGETQKWKDDINKLLESRTKLLGIFADLQFESESLVFKLSLFSKTFNKDKRVVNNHLTGNIDKIRLNIFQKTPGKKGRKEKMNSNIETGKQLGKFAWGQAFVGTKKGVGRTYDKTTKGIGRTYDKTTKGIGQTYGKTKEKFTNRWKKYKEKKEKNNSNTEDQGERSGSGGKVGKFLKDVWVGMTSGSSEEKWKLDEKLEEINEIVGEIESLVEDDNFDGLEGFLEHNDHTFTKKIKRRLKSSITQIKRKEAGYEEYEGDDIATLEGDLDDLKDELDALNHNYRNASGSNQVGFRGNQGNTNIDRGERIQSKEKEITEKRKEIRSVKQKLLKNEKIKSYIDTLKTNISNFLNTLADNSIKGREKKDKERKEKKGGGDGDIYEDPKNFGEGIGMVLTVTGKTLGNFALGLLGGVYKELFKKKKENKK